MYIINKYFNFNTLLSTWLVRVYVYSNEEYPY